MKINFSIRSDRPQRSGFTLVELLVVIGIIIVLMSLLLPVLSVVRGNARSAKCQNRLRQLGAVFQKTKQNVGSRLRPENVRTYFDEYLADTEDVWECPDEPAAEYSYGFNPRMHRLHDEDSYRIVAMDYKKLSMDVVGPDPADSAEWPENHAPRHQANCNVLFFAGNVESRTPQSIDPRVCWVHERHWRPEIDVAMIRTGTIEECRPPENPDNPIEGATDNTTTDGGSDNSGPGPIPDCTIDPIVLDDASPDVSLLGTWTPYAGVGYGSAINFAPAGDGSTEAIWTFFGLPHAEYQVAVTWKSNSNRASNADYRIFDGSETEVTSIAVNQQQDPSSDVTVGGQPFQNLGGAIEIKNGALVVRLSDAGDGFVVADAVRVSCPGDTSSDGSGTTGSTTDGTTDGTQQEEPELLLHYEFDEYTDPGLDSSTEGNHGYVIGPSPTSCGSSSVLVFNGSADYAEAPSFEVGGAFSMAAWVHYNSFKKWSRVIDFGNGSQDNIIVANDGTTSKGAFVIKRGTVDQRIVTGTGFWQTGEWIHVAATVSETGQMKLYKNGSVVGQIAGHAPINLDRTRQFIGKSNFSGDQNFDGMMDDLRIYSVELDAGQISNLASSPPTCAGTDSDVEVYLAFDDPADPYLDTGNGAGDFDGTPVTTLYADCGGDGRVSIQTGGYVGFAKMGISGNHSVTGMAWVKIDGPRLIDDGDSGYAPSGFTSYAPNGFESDHSVAAAGSGANEATYTFSGLSPGSYQVSATWVSKPNRATNSTYKLLDGGTQKASIAANQQWAPVANVIEGGSYFQHLGGAVTINSGTLVVRLTDQANGYVIADAVRIAPPGNPGGNILGFGISGREFSLGTNASLQAILRVGSTVLTANASNMYQGWHHIAGVYDADQGVMRLYWDGTEVAQQNLSNANLSNATYRIGKLLGRNFQGTVDDYRLYGRALSGAEVSAAMGNAPGSCP